MKITASICKKGGLPSKNIFVASFAKEDLSKDPTWSCLSPNVHQAAERFAAAEFKGEEGEIKIFWVADKVARRKTEKIIFLGLGEKERWHERKKFLIYRRMARLARSERLKNFTVVLRQDFGDSQETAQVFATNILLADFEFYKYKETPPQGWPEVKNVFGLTDQNNIQAASRGIKEGMVMGEETNACRILANTPGGEITPVKLAEAAKQVASKNGMAVKILDEKEMEKIGFGGILSVSRGSAEKPRFIILEYLKGPKTQKPLVVVGKGVTFDTGGLSLKPERYMYEMHMDMSGGAAAIHGLAAIARLKLPLNAVVLVPAVENSPSGTSYRPGDILKSLSGKTIEVLNTDAEGRIILADALTYALRYQPGFILDLATLTGAAHVALGNYCSALFTNQEKIQAKLVEIGQASGDYVWPLPLWDEYLGDIKGTFADLANVAKGDKYGGAIHGAKFLEQFVNDTPWAHLDIAPRMTTVESDCLAKGASGVGVRYIVEIAKQFSKLF